jgi:hypothetical protein
MYSRSTLATRFAVRAAFIRSSLFLNCGKSITRVRLPGIADCGRAVAIIENRPTGGQCVKWRYCANHQTAHFERRESQANRTNTLEWGAPLKTTLSVLVARSFTAA